jgi:hypothetical protein
MEGFPNGYALQRRSDMQHQLTFRGSLLQRPSWHHEGYLSGVRCRQEGVHGPKPGNSLEEYLRFQTSQYGQERVFTGTIGSDGAAMCVHYRRLGADRPIVPSASPSPKHEEKNEADPATQEAQDNELVVGSAKHEENNKADPATQEVQDNELVAGSAKHEENNKADPATQKVQDNELVVGTDPGNTNIVTIAAPKRAEDGPDVSSRQKDMLLLKF